MKRRDFIKRGALFVPAIFIPRLIRAQTIATAEGLASFGTNAPSGGGGGCSTSYANAGGSGDRTGSITISEDLIYLNEPTGLIDGNNTSSNTYWILDPIAGGYVRFDLGTAAVINEMKWYQSKTTTHGDWKIQGSNDASSWTDIGSSFTLGGSATQTITAPSANTTAYRYYQLVKVSGNVDQTTFLWEIEFKICTPP